MGDPGPAGDRLEAAAEAAGAGRAVGIEDDMADLAGETADASMETAVEDDAGRDPGPDAEEDQVVDAAELLPAVEAGRAAVRTSFSTTPRDAERGLESLRRAAGAASRD